MEIKYIFHMKNFNNNYFLNFEFLKYYYIIKQLI